jgi:hypothetical protein
MIDTDALSKKQDVGNTSYKKGFPDVGSLIANSYWAQPEATRKIPERRSLNKTPVGAWL